MTTTGPAATTRTVYDLEGTLLEACSCGVLCPCWVGADLDFLVGRRCHEVTRESH